MGNSVSKEEQLYQAVQNSNHNAVKALRRDGASLEILDKEGRTPLILACTRGDLFEMVLTLLNLGANLNAYRPGAFGGFPLHHAAKRGLDKTVLLLLSRGADPLAVNDDSLTPLDLARSRGHVSVVRMIEDQICIFNGMLRELSGPGILEAIAPQWVTKKIWAVVLPTERDPRRTPKFDLVIYQSPKDLEGALRAILAESGSAGAAKLKVSLWNGGGTSPSSHAAGFSNVPVPRTIISLSKVEVEEPNFSSADPVVVILDKNSKNKYKFLAETAGNKVQLERFYKACKGTQIGPAPSGTPQAVSQGLSALSRPTTHPQTHEPPGPSQTNLPRNRIELSEEAALKMAIDASLLTASAEGIVLPTYPGDEAGPSRVSENIQPAEVETPVTPPSAAPPSSPSAPPLPIHYPAIDTSPANVETLTYPAVSTPEEAPVPKADEKGSQCVVCWDAPAEGVCIPCGHLAGCMDCLAQIKAKEWGCPVCRAPIEQVIRVYSV